MNSNVLVGVFAAILSGWARGVGGLTAGELHDEDLVKDETAITRTGIKQQRMAKRNKKVLKTMMGEQLPGGAGQ